MWLIIALTAFFLLGLAAVMDKYLLSKAKIVPLRYAFYISVFGGLISVLLLFFVDRFSWPKDQLWLIILSGLAFYLGLYLMFLATARAEVSKVNPLVISLTPLAVFFLALGLGVEKLAFYKLGGIVLIALASYALAHIGFKKNRLSAGIWGLVVFACLFFALANTLNKIIYQNAPFLEAFIWLRWASAAWALIFTFFLGGWSEVFHFKKQSKKQVHDQRLVFGLNQLAGGLGVLLLQYAISLGSVTIVSALNGLQIFFVMVIIYFLAKVRPHLLEEGMTPHFAHQKFFWSLILFLGVALILI